MWGSNEPTPTDADAGSPGDNNQWSSGKQRTKGGTQYAKGKGGVSKGGTSYWDGGGSGGGWTGGWGADASWGGGGGNGKGGGFGGGNSGAFGSPSDDADGGGGSHGFGSGAGFGNNDGGGDGGGPGGAGGAGFGGGSKGKKGYGKKGDFGGKHYGDSWGKDYGKGKGDFGKDFGGGFGNNPNYHWVAAIADPGRPQMNYAPQFLIKKNCDLNAGVVKYLETWNLGCGGRGGGGGIQGDSGGGEAGYGGGDSGGGGSGGGDSGGSSGGSMSGGSSGGASGYSSGGSTSSGGGGNPLWCDEDLLPGHNYTKDMLPPNFISDQHASSNICSRFVFGCVNKMRSSINAFGYSPTGRRCVLGTNTGDISIWNCGASQGFHFEHGQNIHQGAVRLIAYDYANNRDEVLCTGDQSGQLKFWDANFYNFQTITPFIQGAGAVGTVGTATSNVPGSGGNLGGDNSNPNNPNSGGNNPSSNNPNITASDLNSATSLLSNTNLPSGHVPGKGIGLYDLCFSPGSQKFVCCAETQVVKVLDMATLTEERELTGNGYEVRTVHWDQQRSLVVTGSKDNLVKLYDPRMSVAITTLYHHKNSIAKARFSFSGNQLATVAKDAMGYLLDIRTMKIQQKLNRHQGECTSLSWHPCFDNIVVTGDNEGNVYHWDTFRAPYLHDGSIRPTQVIKSIHDGPIWTITHHPFGHMLVTTGQDASVKFFCRSRPGDQDPHDYIPPKSDFDPLQFGKGKGKGKSYQSPQAQAVRYLNRRLAG